MAATTGRILTDSDGPTSSSCLLVYHCVGVPTISYVYSIPPAVATTSTHAAVPRSAITLIVAL